MTNGGIFGPTLCGKSTVAHNLSREYWARLKMPTLALDIHPQDHGKWGPQAWVTADEEVFWDKVWKATNCVIFVEDASATINRDSSLKEVFTRMRHNGHKLVVIGHSATDLLPGMRNNIDTLWLFRQNAKSSQLWADTMTEPRLMEATELGQYEYLYFQMFKAPIRQKTKKPPG